MKFKVFTMI